MSDSNIESFIFFIGVIVGIWEVVDHPFSDKTTLYLKWIDCRGSEVCTTSYHKIDFLLIPEEQIVASKIAGSILGPSKNENCVVLDKDNWECNGYFRSNLPIGRNNGDWVIDTGDPSWTWESYSWKTAWWLDNIFE